MKRALSTLEPTVIAIGIMLLKEIVDDNKDDLSAFDEQLSNPLGTGDLRWIHMIQHCQILLSMEHVL